MLTAQEKLQKIRELRDPALEVSRILAEKLQLAKGDKGDKGDT